MQGDLNEIDIPSILQLIEWGQRTGQLLVTTHNSCPCQKFSAEVNRHHHCFSCKPQQYWFIFFVNGQIIYCQQGDGSLSRIDDYLRYYRVKLQLKDLKLASLDSVNVAEYSYLWELLERNLIQPKVAREILYGLVCETLFDLLSLHAGCFSFHHGTVLTPQLTTWEISPLIKKIVKQLQNWQQMYPHIQSPNQVPVISEEVQSHSGLPVATINKLTYWADGKTSLRQLARCLNRDVYTVAKAIYPYVLQGWLQLVYSNTCDFDPYRENSAVEVKSKVRILSIQEAHSNSEAIKSILQPQGYEVLTLTNPLESLSLIFQLKPDMIFCDMAMPELDGYEICAMLRQSTAFRLLPIILLSDRDRFLDRVKAKMVGTTDYLVKPLRDTELLTLIETYLK
ncbi:response regulator receiver protein [Calothrix brevissima NIES-22]|nr:response regulator receiver protein [Calothrix brevissima NIES-22]